MCSQFFQRTLEQLKKSNDILSGPESQILRSYCSSEYLDVKHGLDDTVGKLLKNDDLAGLKAHLNSHFNARLELWNQKWGPTKIPIYNVLLTLVYMQPERRQSRMEMVRYLADEAKVPVDGTDLAGSSALMYAISTKPYLDFEFADIMIGHEADINRRNRYGCTAAHDIVMLQSPEHEERSVSALRWFIAHRGNPDIKDGDGMSPRYMATRLTRLAPELARCLTRTNTPTGNISKKVGRNDPCLCNSGKKFKVCCGKP